MKTILVVDDEADLRMGMAAMFTDRGYRVIEAGNAEEAEMRLAAVRPDLITLDVRLRGRSGLSYYQGLRKDERYRDIPVIFVSAYGQARDFEGGRFGKVTDAEGTPAPEGFLEKPFRPEQLLALVDGLLGPGVD